MKGYEKSLVVVVVTAVALVDAFKNGRSIGLGRTVFESSNYPTYQGPRQHPPYHEQHRPFREQSFGQAVRSYRQPTTSYRERSVFGDYSSYKNRPSHYRETSYQSSPSSYEVTSSSYGTRPSFGNEYTFQDEYYKNRSPFQSSQRYLPKEMRESTSWITSYQEEPYEKSLESYKDLEKETEERSPFDERTNYLKYGNHGLGFASIPEASDENTLPLDTETSTSLSTTLTATRKPLVEGTVSTTAQTISEVRSSSTTDSKIAPKSATTITTTSRPTVETNTLGSAISSSTSTIMLPTMLPMSSATPKQYSDVTNLLMTLTTSSNSTTTVTEPPTGSFNGNVLLSSDKPTSTIHPTPSFVPNDFKNGLFNTIWKQSDESTSSLKNSNQDNTFNLPTTSLKPNSVQDLLNLSASQQATFQEVIQNLQNSWKTSLQNSLLNIQNSPKNTASSTILNYLPTEQPKANGAIFNYVLPSSDSKLTFKDNFQEKFVNYVLPEESKRLLNSIKNNAQNTYLDFILREQPKRDVTFAPVQSQTQNYIPLIMPREQKMNLQMNAISPISRPMENVNYLPTMMPYLNTAPTSSPQLTLGSSLPESLSNGLQGSLSASIPNGIVGGIPSGISAGIPNGIATGMPGSITNGIHASIPTTMDFQQTFQQPVQIRPLQTTVAPYSGMQLQLGGFSGIDYGIRPNEQEVRPMEFGIAKVGLNLPEFQRPQVPTFAKIGFGQQMW